MTAAPSGQLVTIDAAILQEVYTRLAEAIAAVTRANVRAEGVLLERRCTAAILATGRAGEDCPPPD